MASRRSATFIVVAVLTVVAAMVGVGIAYVASRPSSGEAGRTEASPDAAVTQLPSPANTPVTQDEPSPLFGGDQNAATDATGTIVAILRAHARGDTAAVAMMAEESAAAQLSSYPRDGFDIAAVRCAPDPSDPTRQFTCTLEPSRKPLGAAEARLQRRDGSFVLVAVVPLVT